MFLIPWVTPPTLTQFEYEKQVLLSENDIEKYHQDEKQYDMSYIDEQKLADLFGKKRGVDLLLERNRSQLDSNYTTSRPPSFVLFTIVSDEHPRDISAYTSRQELAFNSGTTTPLRGTPGTTRRRYHDLESHTSMYSLRHSLTDVTHVQHEAETPENDCTEYAAIHLIQKDVTLETVEEVNEGERKISSEEKQSSQIDIEITEANELTPDEDSAPSVTEEENSLRSSSWCPTDSNGSWKNYSQSSAATIDSGYEECTDTSTNDGKLAPESVWIDTETRYSIDNLTEGEKTEPVKDLYYSKSCNDITKLSELSYDVTNPQKTLWEAQSVEIIDNHSCDEDHKNELITYLESPLNETEGSNCTVSFIADDALNYSTPPMEDGNLCAEKTLIVDSKDHCIKRTDDQDVFSLLVEDVLEFELGGNEYLDSYKKKNQLESAYLYGGKYRETVV
jgi:hypothetical protein